MTEILEMTEEEYAKYPHKQKEKWCYIPTGANLELTRKEAAELMGFDLIIISIHQERGGYDWLNRDDVWARGRIHARRKEVKKYEMETGNADPYPSNRQEILSAYSSEYSDHPGLR